MIDRDEVTRFRQVLADSIATPLGSIPHRPDFGSRIYEYLDRPLNPIAPLVIAEIHRVATRIAPDGLEIQSVRLRRVPHHPERTTAIVRISGGADIEIPVR